jgi:uncharacterized protein
MPPAAQGPWRINGATLLLRIRLTPKGGRDAIDGLTTTADGPALKARVRAAPEDGAANDALEKLIADEVGIPRRDVALTAGHKSRVKLIALTGEPAELAARLGALIAGATKR